MWVQAQWSGTSNQKGVRCATLFVCFVPLVVHAGQCVKPAAPQSHRGVFGQSVHKRWKVNADNRLRRKKFSTSDAGTGVRASMGRLKPFEREAAEFARTPSRAASATAFPKACCGGEQTVNKHVNNGVNIVVSRC